MAKFNIKLRKGRQQPVTAQGAPGFAREPRVELFLLAVTNMVGEDTFYEAAGERDERFRDPGTSPRGRGSRLGRASRHLAARDANLRSASLVAAAEAVKGRLDAGEVGHNRQVIAGALHRADEPGELLAYWTSRYGRAIPKPVKRGVADAVGRLYTERAVAKYDTDAAAYRFGDVLELTHPAPTKPWQGDLFAYAIGRRHGRGRPGRRCRYWRTGSGCSRCRWGSGGRCWRGPTRQRCSPRPG